MSIAMVSGMHVILTKVFPTTRLRDIHLYFLIVFSCLYVCKCLFYINTDPCGFYFFVFLHMNSKTARINTPYNTFCSEDLCSGRHKLVNKKKI